MQHGEETQHVLCSLPNVSDLNTTEKGLHTSTTVGNYSIPKKWPPGVCFHTAFPGAVTICCFICIYVIFLTLTQKAGRPGLQDQEGPKDKDHCGKSRQTQAPLLQGPSGEQLSLLRSQGLSSPPLPDSSSPAPDISPLKLWDTPSVTKDPALVVLQGSFSSLPASLNSWYFVCCCRPH